MKRSYLSLSILGLLFLVPGIALAALTGDISGNITDNTNQPLPGATVTVTGVNLQGARTVQTNATGFYRVPLLPPGSYDIAVSMVGMNTVERKGIEVNLNKIARVDLTMELSTVTQIVVVTADAPVIDTTSAKVGVNIDRSFTDRLPQNDSFQSAFTMGAGSVGGGNPNIHGGTNIDNVVLFDGIDVTDPVTHTFAQNLNADAIEEVEVQTGGFEAEYGRSMGGIVNAVTKTGGNTFEGIFRLKYVTDTFNSKPNSSEKPENKINDNYEPTFSLGGPILKDKLWFFLSYRRTVVHNTNDVRIGYDPVTETYTFASVKNDEIWQYGHANITWNITESQNFQVSYSTDPTVLKNYDGDSDYHYAPEAQAQRKQGGDRYGLTYNNIISSQFYINAKLGFFNSYIYIEPQSDSGMPAIHDTEYGIWTQNFNEIDKNDRSKWQGDLTANYFVDNLLGGSHEFKVGLQYFELINKHTRQYSTGRYYETEAGQPYARYQYSGSNQDDNQKAHYLGFFIQDSYETAFGLQGLTVKPGIRLERAEYFNREKTKVHTFDLVAGPRLGAIYDVNKDGKSKIYTSYGRYYKLDDLNIIWGDPGQLASAQTWIYDPSNPGADSEGYYFEGQGDASVPNLLDKDIKPEKTDEIIVGYDRAVMNNFSVGARYIYRYTNDIWEDIGYYVDDQGVLHRVDEIDWSDPNAAKNFWDAENKDGWYVTNPHGAYRRYQGIELSATIKLEKLSLEGSYTYSEAKGTLDTMSNDGTNYNTPFTGLYDNPYDSLNLNGPLGYDSPHYFKVNGSYRLPWGISIGTSSYWRKGYPYQRLVKKPTGLGTGRYMSDEGRGAYRKPDVWRINLSLQKDFDFGKYGLATFIIDVINVTDNQMALDVNYNDGTTFGKEEAWMQPRYVEFQLKYSF